MLLNWVIFFLKELKVIDYFFAYSSEGRDQFVTSENSENYLFRHFVVSFDHGNECIDDSFYNDFLKKRVVNEFIEAI